MCGKFLHQAILLACLFSTAWLCCSRAPAADFKAGDEVVAVYQTEIKVDNKPLATLPAGSYLTVKNVNGDWISVSVEAAGKKITGWVYAKHVQAFQANNPKAAGRAAARQLITAEMIDAQLISNDEDKVTAYIGIACDQASAGDVAGAKATAARIIDPSQRTMAYWAIAYRQVQMGDSPEALHTLELAKTAAAQISEDYVRASKFRLIARVQVSAGDVAGAKATAAQISDQGRQSQAYFAIAETQMKAGDWAAAKATASQISDEFLRVLARDEIVAAEAKTGGVTAVFKFIAGATSNPRESCELLRTAVAEMFRTP